MRITALKVGMTHSFNASPASVRCFAPVLLCLTLLVASCGGQTSTGKSSGSGSSTYPSQGTWALVWSDEFDGANGSSPDSTKWNFDVGGGGWGNNELESYTSRLENAHLENGNLVITAVKESYTGSDGIARSYTSARLKTQGKFSQKYGKFEARIKIPAGQGVWPAFWLLGDNASSSPWPACGEIDIMENVGKEPSIVHGSMHGPGYSGGSALTASYSLPGGQRFSDGYHTFTAEWEPDVVRFYVDGQLYETRTPSDIGSSAWVFDHPFFLLVNLAVGGNWPGSPDQSSVFPQSMLVDYVRVYSRK